MIKLAWTGPPQVKVDEQRLHFETRKITALLAYLSLNPQGCPREKLAALFWPESDQSHAQGNLRRALGSLIHTLPPDSIEADRERVRWQAELPVEIDILQLREALLQVRQHDHELSPACPECLQRLEKATAAIRGDFLEGLNLPDCPYFDEWQYLLREEVRRDLSSALEHLANMAASQGDWEKAVAAAQHRVSLDRLESTAQIDLVRIYIRSGKRSLAQRQVDEFARLYKDEYGEAMDSETHAQFQQALRPDRDTAMAIETAPIIKPSTARLNLLLTKLESPGLNPGWIKRQRLLQLLREIPRHKLTLISAPAGFGKTTLLATYAAICGMPVAWLSLDKHDNQVERFLRYLIAALQEAGEQAANQAGQILLLPQQMGSEVVLTSLINDLVASGRENILVLDDYQQINNQAVHEAVVFLLEHAPQSLHLVIATRSDPPLPLARLHGRGQLLELRTADLRFSDREATQFLNEAMGLSLDAGAVTALTERTEGWIAGLQMAALSLRGREDVGSFIKGFSGTHRYILDYLLEEVLAGLPAQVQHFLLHTSILERLSAALCDTLLEGTDRLTAAAGGQLPQAGPSSPGKTLPLTESSAMLEYLERANLFLVPLDDQRHWYRYHQLFSDLLQTQLHKTYGDHGIASLHRRASEWFEQNNLTLEAIHHASLAQDYTKVEKIIEKNYIQMSNQGEMYWVRYWVGKLSQDLVYQRPWLCLYQALNHAWFGQVEEAKVYLEEAQKRIDEVADPAEAQSMQAYHDYIQSRVIAIGGDTRGAIRICQAALESLPAGKLGFEIDFNITLGFLNFLAGEFSEAEMTLLREIDLAHPVNAVNNPVAAYCLLARMRFYQGNLHQAYTFIQKATQLIQKAEEQSFGVTGLLDLESARLFYEWDDLETAQEQINESLKLLPYWGKTDDTVLALVLQARIHLAQCSLIEAGANLEKAIQLVQTCGVFSEARQAVEAARASLWLARGDQASAERWATSLSLPNQAGNLSGYESEPTQMACARVWITLNRLPEAGALLAELEANARSSARQGRLIEILNLRARLLQQMGEIPQALECLEECLELAGAEGYLRSFVDEGLPLQQLLDAWLSQGAAHAASAGYANRLRDYAVHLRAHFRGDLTHDHLQADHLSPGASYPAMNRVAMIDTKIQPVTQNLVEPLSPRELEVLDLIAQGKTNLEIAQLLVVASGTIKAHASSIYRKLEATNRTEAVARARQLKILP